MSAEWFWVPVVLFAVQYGARTGVIAAAVAVSIYVLGGWPPRESIDDFYSYFLRIWHLPVLLLAAAAVFGELTDTKNKTIARLQARARDTDERLAAIGRYARELLAGKRQLERMVSVAPKHVDENCSYGAGVEALIDLARAPKSIAGHILVETMERLIGPITFRLLAVKSDKLYEISPTECGGLAATRVTNTEDRQVFAAVKSRKRVLSALRSEDAALISGTMVAVPVADPFNKAIVGVLCVDNIDPALINRQTEAALIGISASLSAIIRKSDWGQSSRRMRERNRTDDQDNRPTA